MFRNDALMWGAAGTMKMLARINATKTMPAAAPACSHLFSFMFSPLSGPPVAGGLRMEDTAAPIPLEGGHFGQPCVSSPKVGLLRRYSVS